MATICETKNEQRELLAQAIDDLVKKKATNDKG